MSALCTAGAQLTKVRGLMLASLAVVGAAAWWGWSLYESYGVRPADGGVLALLGTRLAVGLGLAGSGAASAVLGSTYVAGRLLNPVGVSVNALWIKVRIEGMRLPLIGDAQGELLDRPLIAELFRLGD